MDDVRTILLNSTERLLGDLVDQNAGDPAGWRRIEDMGLPLALVNEDKGGLGLDDEDGLDLVRMCGRHITAFPVVETMLANRFAASTGEGLFDGPVYTLGDLTGPQREHAALARAMQMTGALETILSMTIAHVRDREQFGRPIAKFQAVQHSLSIMAGEVAAATAAADHAVGKQGDDDALATLAVGLARVRIGEACSKVAALAHQLHGAIGYTREHRLHVYTKAVWTWRDQFGTQAWWSKQVGRAVLDNGRDNFWSMVTAA